MRGPSYIPAPAVRRLSLYLRHLETLQDGKRRTVSSRELGEALRISDAQVRKDLGYFGQFGHPGIGYRVDELVVRVRGILGTDRDWNVLLVGVGNLGRALVRYRGFDRKGFHVVAAFDVDPKVIGTRVRGTKGIVVQPMREMRETVRRHGIQLAILAVPAESAQAVAEEVKAADIRGILNFAPLTLQDTGCALAAVDLSVHLEQLSFQICGRDR